MNGKDKCRILKDIRRQIAEANDIEWIVSECKHKGECKGTCPKCEAEVRKLESELSLRRKLGRAVAITGVSAACLTGFTACTMDDVIDIGSEIIENIGIKNKEEHEPVIDGEIEPYTEEYWLDGDVAIVYPDDGLAGDIQEY